MDLSYRPTGDDVNDPKTKSDIMWSHDRYRKAEKIISSFNTDIDIKGMGDSDLKTILDLFDVEPITNPYTIYACVMVPRGMKMISVVKNKQ